MLTHRSHRTAWRARSGVAARLQPLAAARIAVGFCGALGCVQLVACAELAASAPRFDALRESIETVTRSGAYKCAPRELALARAHFVFAGVQLQQGNAKRAAQHLEEAEENVGAAQVLSPPERCSGQNLAHKLPSQVIAVHAPATDANRCNAADADGCGELDRDGDGLKDRIDMCPEQPEDFDGYRDQDGCPDLDNDADGIADAQDACPNTAGPVATNGCPTKDYPDVTLTERGLRLATSISFDGNSATIRSVSFPLLDTIAELLRDHSRMTLEIGAHTDSQGDDTENLLSSQERAESVRKYLLTLGIDPARLTARGYGETRPIESNSTSQGRAINRRIELVRTDRAP